MQRDFVKAPNPHFDRNLAEAIFFVAQVCVVAAAEFCLGGFLNDDSIAGRIARASGLLLLCSVVQFFSATALSQLRRREWRRGIWIYLSLLLSIFVVAIGKIFVLGLVSYGEAHGSFSTVTENALMFALPTTVSVLIVQSIWGIQYGMITAILNAAILTTYSPTPALTLPLVLTSSLVGSLSFLRVRSRSAYLKAALNIGLVGIPFAIISIVLSSQPQVVDGVARIMSCLVAGCLSAFIAVGITPIVEYLGEYVSDMRLIEMATLDHPLLKELSIQAPGTWNHSMVMGMMVESAADAINANPVVCRVGAYFHDIGKMKKPLYFVENQNPGENRHDKLSPSMSALIIRSHVKDGVELARKHKLPKVIEDMIPQHHGTSTIEYFLEKARKDAEESGAEIESVDRSLYSYPGPKPQTREAGLLMLADGIEAAARTLGDPTFDRIQGMVQKMINKVFSSGELNECELTLRDLHSIAKCFTRVLSGIYHQRIAYAEPAEKNNDGEDSSSSEAGEESNARGESQRRTKPEENLKRLGLE